MQIQNTVQGKRGTSVVRAGAGWHTAVVAVLGLFGQTANANQICADLFRTAGYAPNLEACRPAPISNGEKRAILESLPSDGEVKHLSESEQRKLHDLTAMLRLHGREGVYQVKVISVPQAWAGLHERAVVLISRPALRLLNSEELQGVVAHEIGHEYMWQQYELARARNDNARLRELELNCDAIAVLSLERIGVNPERLVTALEKLSWFNVERFGRPANASSYPPARERRKLVQRMCRRANGF